MKILNNLLIFVFYLSKNSINFEKLFAGMLIKSS